MASSRHTRPINNRHWPQHHRPFGTKDFCRTDDVGRHVAWVREFEAAGFTHVTLIQAGADPQELFITCDRTPARSACANDPAVRIPRPPPRQLITNRRFKEPGQRKADGPLGLTVPVIAVGYGAQAFGDFRATLACAIALAAIAVASMATIRRTAA